MRRDRKRTSNRRIYCESNPAVRRLKLLAGIDTAISNRTCIQTQRYSAHSALFHVYLSVSFTIISAQVLGFVCSIKCGPDTLTTFKSLQHRLNISKLCFGTNLSFIG